MELQSFTKMHGLGNDFLIFPWKGDLPEKNIIKMITSRNKGIGCDLIVFLFDLLGDVADYRAHFFNYDGTSAEICGNALRCIGKLHYEKFNSKNCVVETDSGLIDIECNQDGSVSVDIGFPKFSWKDIPLTNDIDSYDLGFNFDYLKKGFALNVGNPHLIFFVENINKKLLSEDSKKIEDSKLFPEGVNITVAKVVKKNQISIVTNERGVGITLACGTGACASVVAGHKMNLLEDKVLVEMLGGSIKVEIASNNHIFMTGDAIKVFEGKIDLEEFKNA